MKHTNISKKMLPLIICAVVLYTVADFLLQYFAHIEVSTTLTTAWFAFWGTELVSLAAIKTSKVKHHYGENEQSEVDEDDKSNDSK